MEFADLITNDIDVGRIQTELSKDETLSQEQVSVVENSTPESRPKQDGQADCSSKGVLIRFKDNDNSSKSAEDKSSPKRIIS